MRFLSALPACLLSDAFYSSFFLARSRHAEKRRHHTSLARLLIEDNDPNHRLHTQPVLPNHQLVKRTCLYAACCRFLCTDKEEQSRATTNLQDLLDVPKRLKGFDVSSIGPESGWDMSVILVIRCHLSGYKD